MGEGRKERDEERRDREGGREGDREERPRESEREREREGGQREKREVKLFNFQYLLSVSTPPPRQAFTNSSTHFLPLHV